MRQRLVPTKEDEATPHLPAGERGAASSPPRLPAKERANNSSQRRKTRRRLIFQWVNVRTPAKLGSSRLSQVDKKAWKDPLAAPPRRTKSKGWYSVGHYRHRNTHSLPPSSSIRCLRAPPPSAEPCRQWKALLFSAKRGGEISLGGPKTPSLDPGIA
ncbi:hypothetical protein GW17_00025876 [Ensete ventricosum]|nr:hypothetical protein GW17_00025876 [Ensete ventricosum]